MKKRLSIIFVLTIVCCISVVSFAGCKGDNTKEPTYDKFFSDWQSNIKDDVLLKEVVMAGSHDAMTRGMMAAACTQSSTIANQLSGGVRYFDLRVAKKGSDFVAFHGIVKGDIFAPIAKEINDFVLVHPTETLVLDFQHFENSKEGVLKILEEVGLDKLAVKNSTQMSELDFVDSLTLGQCRGKVLILWGDSEADDYFGRDYLFRRNNDSGSLIGAALDSYYDSALQKLGSEKFVATALETYFEKYIAKDKGLFVLQGQLTASNIVGSLAKLEQTHQERMSNYIKSLANDKEKLSYVNIIMRDFVTDGNKIKEIISLNIAKDNVKDNAADEFTKKCK